MPNSGNSGEGKADKYQLLTPTQNTVLGISAGTIEVVILQPMLYCKNATQQNLKLTLNPKILYRGLMMSIVNMSVLTGLQFPLTGMVTNAINGGSGSRLSDGEQIAAGFLGGAISGVACAPMELVMIQQQRFAGSIFSTPGRLVSSFGFASLFRGLVTSCGREGMFTAGYMGIGPVVNRTVVEDYGYSPATGTFAGAVGGGVIAATLSHPMDTIKTCMQGDIEQKTYTSLSGTARKLYQEAGLSRFFQGWAWRTSRMICAVAIMGECKTRLAPIFYPSLFED